jgi:hypothetical protein
MFRRLLRPPLHGSWPNTMTSSVGTAANLRNRRTPRTPLLMTSSLTHAEFTFARHAANSASTTSLSFAHSAKPGAFTASSAKMWLASS